MSAPGVLVGIYAVLVALELPPAIIAKRNGTRTRSLMIPAALFVAAILIPDTFAKFGLLSLSLLAMFGIAIVGRFRRSNREESDYLVAHGPTPWPAERRRQSRNLLVTGVIWTASAIAVDAINGHRTIVTVLLFPTGSLLVGFSLVRSHAVLVTYFGKRRARWLELVQAAALISAYIVVTTAEMNSDSSRRLQLRILSVVPLAIHFLFVWLPLARTQEQWAPPDQADTRDSLKWR